MEVGQVLSKNYLNLFSCLFSLPLLSFRAVSLTAIQSLAAAENSSAPFAARAVKAIGRNSPLAMAVALDMIRSLRASKATVAEALVQEYRFTARAIEFGDFAEGIRAAIIDKDKNPQWKHALGAVPQEMVDHMRAPLGDMELNLTGEHS